MTPRRGRIAFVGDSLTHRWSTTGAAVWAERFAPLGAVERGVDGETTTGTLARIEGGLLERDAPEAVVLLIGTNDLGDGASATTTLANVRDCVRAIRRRVPDARLLVLALLPRDDGDVDTATLDDVNARLATGAREDGVQFANVAATFRTADGALLDERYEPDRLHLSPAGYRAFADALAEPLRALSL